MANNYCMFSLNTPGQQDLGELELFKARWDKKMEEDGDWIPEVNVMVQQSRDPATADQGWLWIYAEEGGNIEGAAELIEDFLKTFNFPKEQGVFISWASTCSKPRVGEFGGGGMVVTREGVLTIINEYDACREAAEGGVEIVN